MATPNKIDSNVTGLRFAEEASLKTLPGTPVWHSLEPNSYKDFGGQITSLARKPISASRQLQKGVTTDLEADGGINQDLTMNNTTRLLQGFFFADIREKKTTQPMNAAATLLTGVTAATKTVAAAAGLAGFLASNLVLASGFGNSANNGLKSIASASTATAVVVNETMADEVPGADAKLEVVGYQFASATVDVTMNASLVRLSRASGTFDFTTLGLIPGEWIFLGGDAVATTFTNNKGFARISAITATYIEFDKVNWAGAVAEVGTGKTIRIFYGSVLKNESDPLLIKRRTYQLERTLGNDGTGTQSEYLIGAVPNELSINIQQADKVTVDLDFIALDNEQRDGATGLKSGTRPTLVPASAFNTSSDMSRIKLSLVSATDAAPAALFAFATEVTVSIKNNVSPNKAVGVLGAFDTSAGNFEVGGKMTAYFASVGAVSAIRNNSDVTIDILMQKRNKAMLLDVPLLALGDGRLNVEQDQPITLPLDVNAAASKFDHTLLFQSFSYLPDAAGGL